MGKISSFILWLSLAVALYGQSGRDITTIGGGAGADAIQLSGEMKVTDIFSGRSLQEGRWWGTRLPLRTANYWNVYGMVRMDIAISDGIDGVVAVENNPYQFDSGPANTQIFPFSDFMFAQIGLLNFRVKELFTQGLSLTAGIEDFKLDWRGRGQPFFMDVRNAFSPWTQVNSAIPHILNTPPGAFPNFVGGYVNRHPVGLTLDYAASPIDFEIMAADVNTNLFNNSALGAAGNFASGAQEDIALANFSYDLGKGSAVNFLISWFRGGTNIDQSGFVIGGPDSAIAAQQDVFTGGLGWDARDFLTTGLEFYAEGYLQDGDAGENLIGNKIKQSGSAAYGGFRYEFQNKYKPWIDASFWFKSGDKHFDGVDNRYQGFLDYGNVTDFTLVEDKIFGLRVGTGYYAPKVETGFTVDVGNGRTMDFTAKWADFRWDYAAPLDSAPFSSNKLGNEIDLTATLNYSKNVSFFVKWAGLFNSDSLQYFTSAPSKRANLILLGSRIVF